MKLQKCIDALAFDGVPEGSHLVQLEPKPGLIVTEINAENVAESGPLFFATQFRASLQWLLADIPANVDLTPDHFTQIASALEEYYNAAIRSLVLAELRTTMENERDRTLQKLEQLDRASACPSKNASYGVCRRGGQNTTTVRC